MSKITIVTAFFHIGREDWKGFQKTDEEYFGYFSFWARMKNRLIVYVSTEEQAEEVRKIRKGFGLGEETFCVVIEDIFSVDKELYGSLVRTARYKGIGSCRLRPKNPESWNPDYNYIMLMKEWCVKDAVERKLAKGMIAWLDFGFNKGGVLYTEREEMAFEWSYPFPEKINVFSIQEMEGRPPVYEIIRDMTTFLQGGVIVAPDYLWERLWEAVKRNMLFLNRLGLMDDDQTVLLLSYMEQPDIFSVHSTDWMMQLKEFGNEKLTVRIVSAKKLGPIKKLYAFLYDVFKGRRKDVRSYLKAQKKNIMQNIKKGYR